MTLWSQTEKSSVVSHPLKSNPGRPSPLPDPKWIHSWNIPNIYTAWSGQLSRMICPLLLIRQTLGSNLKSETEYHERGFSRYSSVFLCKCLMLGHDRFFQHACNALFRMAVSCNNRCYSSVGMAMGSKARDWSLLDTAETSSKAHPSPNPIGTRGSFLICKVARVKLPTYIHGVVSPLPYTSSWYNM
jgi:hypothetical protein